MARGCIVGLLVAACALQTPPPGTAGGAGPLPEAPLAASVDPWRLTNESFIDSLTATWAQSDRDALREAAAHGVVVARLERERLVPVPGCRVDGAYQRIPGERSSVRMGDANELADVMLLGGKRYLPVVRDVGELVVDSHAVTVLRFESKVYFSAFPRARLSGSCAGATHVIEQLWLGAYELAARDADGSTLIREGGRLKHCEKLGKGEPPASCQALIAIDARPIADAPPTPARDPNEPFEYSPGTEPHCPVPGALRFHGDRPYCAERQQPGEAPQAKNLKRFEIRGPLALDRDTGLVWRRDSPPDTMSWQRAREYCHGFEGFMLPTPSQLATLIEPELFPAADLGVFPDLASGELSFWTVDRSPVGPDTGSTMSFERGSFSSGASALRARCVRLPHGS